MAPISRGMPNGEKHVRSEFILQPGKATCAAIAPLFIMIIKYPRPIFNSHSQEHSLSFSSRFVNLKVTQLLIS